MIPSREHSPDIEELKKMLQAGAQEFWKSLAAASKSAGTFSEMFTLSNLRKKALKKGLPGGDGGKVPLRIALIGGFSLYPLNELVEHLLSLSGFSVELFTGEFDNYISEILTPDSELHRFKPHVAFLIPSSARCKYEGKITDTSEVQRQQVEASARQVLDLCASLHASTGCEVILANYIPSGHHDLGVYKARTLASDWNFKRAVNIELGLRAQNFTHICDLEFMSYREGYSSTFDSRAWFETKQPASPDFLVRIAKEISHIVGTLKKSAKKVLVLDLDNTLWGGVIGDDGLEGIQLGDTSARGEAFKSFQKYVATLPERGFLLAVCSKNEYANAIKPFNEHPEMVLKPENIVSFKANWNPKSDNIKDIAAELNLGLDSFVFVDDNPAEIEIVRRFVPEVTTILLGDDPSEFIRLLQDSRLFEVRTITEEDRKRTELYRQEASRKALSSSMTDMKSYLKSLEMQATITEFNSVDVSRLSQLINKSNQFNLTTKRRTESEVTALIGDAEHVAFSIRLSDKFGDHGLISILIGKLRSSEKTMEIDTWLMSCRVLQRNVEEEALNEFVRLSRSKGCEKLVGVYLPTAKNEMVRDFYERMGFELISEKNGTKTYVLSVTDFKTIPTQISITRRSYGAS